MLNKEKRKYFKELEEDDVSIFDSDEETKKDKKNSAHTKEEYKANSRDRKKLKGKQPGKRRNSRKNREQQLDMAEYQIMKKLMDPQAASQAQKTLQQDESQDKEQRIFDYDNTKTDDFYRDKLDDNCIIQGGEDEVNLQQIYVEDGLMDYDQYNKIEIEDHEYPNNYYPHPPNHAYQTHYPPNHHQTYPNKHYNKYTLIEEKFSYNNHVQNISYKDSRQMDEVDYSQEGSIKRIYDRIGFLRQEFKGLLNEQVRYVQKVLEGGENRDKSDEMKGLTKDRLKVIQEIIQRNPFIYPSQIMPILANNSSTQPSISKESLFHLLNLSEYVKTSLENHKYFNKNTPEAISQRYLYSQSLESYKRSNYHISYYDEMIINEHYNRKNVWCNKKEYCRDSHVGKLEQSFVVLVFLRQDGACSWTIRFGDYSSHLHLKIVDTFINQSKKGSNLFVMNRLPHRNVSEITNSIEQKGIKVLKLPQNSHQLNPLSTFFDQIQTQLRNYRFQGLESLMNKIVSLFQKANSNKFGVKCYKQVQAFVEKSLKRQYF